MLQAHLGQLRYRAVFLIWLYHGGRVAAPVSPTRPDAHTPIPCLLGGPTWGGPLGDRSDIVPRRPNWGQVKYRGVIFAALGTGQISCRVLYLTLSWRTCCRSSLTDTPIHPHAGTAGPFSPRPASGRRPTLGDRSNIGAYRRHADTPARRYGVFRRPSLGTGQNGRQIRQFAPWFWAAHLGRRPTWGQVKCRGVSPTRRYARTPIRCL